MLCPAIKVTAPMLYVACLLPAIMGVIGALIFIETVWGFNRFNTLYANGDLGGGVSVLVLGGLIFVSLTLGVLRLELTALPGVLDHLRHCVLLYPLCAFLFAVLIAGYETTTNSIGGADLWYVAAAALFLMSSWAIVLNAVILLWKRRTNLQPTGVIT
ncbi:hypothetical protein BH20ACT11_BH20ACT11_05050 [soil metagenome]